MWYCAACGYTNYIDDFKCGSCKRDNPDFIEFNTEQREKAEEIEKVKKIIKKLFASIYKANDGLCEVRERWDVDIEIMEEHLLDEQAPDIIQKKTDRLNQLKMIKNNISDLASDICCQIEEPLEKMISDIELRIDSYAAWGKVEYDINQTITHLKKCSDAIYPLILYAESINEQKKGLSGAIKRLSKFALELQNAIDTLNDEFHNAETVPDCEEKIAKYTDEYIRNLFADREDPSSAFEFVTSDAFYYAVRCVVNKKRASTSWLQARRGISYGNAYKMLFYMEEMGLIENADSYRGSEVLPAAQQFLEDRTPSSASEDFPIHKITNTLVKTDGVAEKEKRDSLDLDTDKPWEMGIEPDRMLFAVDSKEMTYFPDPSDPSCCIRITPDNPVFVYSYNGVDYYVPSDLVKRRKTKE